MRNLSGRDRLSLAFFFDPSFDSSVAPVEDLAAAPDDSAERWDGRSVHDLSGTYGEYLMSKVAKVFPHLWEDVA